MIWWTNVKNSMSTYRDIRLWFGRIWQNITKSNTHWYMLISVLILFFWSAYGELVRLFFDKKVLPFLDFESNLWSAFAMTLIVVIAIGDVIDKFFRRYLFHPNVLFLMIWTVIIFNYYIIQQYYTFTFIFGKITYVELINGVLITYTLVGIINWIRCGIEMDEISSESSERGKLNANGLLRDKPIDAASQDALALHTYVENIVEEIAKLDKQLTWSIAITAEWGVGKTSFLKMVIDQLDKGDYEIIWFNPRNTKAYQNIQVEFFYELTSTLKKYDMRCVNLIKEYLAALQLVDNRGIISKILNVYYIWDRKDVKDRLIEVFKNIQKRVIVVIDDFDRLGREEIMEVLKLVDSNATFTNLIFLTAYDKSQVNRVVGNNTDKANFVDKFFDVEYAIPIRPYSLISNYIIDMLAKLTDATEQEAIYIHDAIVNQLDIIEKYLPTLRDAKRFINQFVLDFKDLKGEVNLRDYILIQLVKYNDYAEYMKLYNREYLINFAIFGNNEIYFRNELANSSPISQILKVLFPAEKEDREDTFKMICEKRSFSNYFLNQVNGVLKLSDMQQVFTLPIGEAKELIRQWTMNDEKWEDFISYLKNFNNEKFTTKNQFLRYTDIIVLSATQRNETFAYWLLLRLVYNDHIKSFNKIYKIDTQQYIQHIKDVLFDLDWSPQSELARGIYYHMVSGDLREDELSIKKEDLLAHIKNCFENKILLEDYSEEDKISYLYSCVSEIDKGTSQIHLDRECCKVYREYIEMHPAYYIDKFVRLAMVPMTADYNSITCEPFWNQIFDSERALMAFFTNCETQGVNKIDVVKRFWEMYQANDYQPIDFHNEGDVAQKISDGLINEYDRYKQLVQINTELDKMDKIDYSKLSISDLTKARESIEELNNQWSMNQLSINLQGKIVKKLSDIKHRINESISAL